MKKYLLLLGMVSILQTSANAQCCFGMDMCMELMGRFGISAGYGFQGYSAEGFNSYIQHYNQKRTEFLTKQMGEFGGAASYWFGGKLFQYYIPESKLLVNTRVMFHITSEKEFAKTQEAQREYTLTTATFGFGVGFNYVMHESFDIKIMELYATMSSAGLKNELIDPVNGNTKQELESADGSFGAILYTGFVYYPLPPYIGLEVNLGYSFMDIPEMKFKSNNAYLQVNEDTARRMSNFIDGGGFSIHAIVTVAFDVDAF